MEVLYTGTSRACRPQRAGAYSRTLLSPGQQQVRVVPVLGVFFLEQLGLCDVPHTVLTLIDVLEDLEAEPANLQQQLRAGGAGGFQSVGPELQNHARVPMPAQRAPHPFENQAFRSLRDADD